MLGNVGDLRKSLRTIRNQKVENQFSLFSLIRFRISFSSSFATPHLFLSRPFHCYLFDSFAVWMRVFESFAIGNYDGDAMWTFYVIEKFPHKFQTFFCNWFCVECPSFLQLLISPGQLSDAGFFSFRSRSISLDISPSSFTESLMRYLTLFIGFPFHFDWRRTYSHFVTPPGSIT